MTVIISSNTPLPIRGILKRWFIEPKANVFVGTVNSKVRDKVMEFIKRNSDELNMLIITSDNSSQGFKTIRYGKPDRTDFKMSGNWLISEKNSD